MLRIKLQWIQVACFLNLKSLQVKAGFTRTRSFARERPRESPPNHRRTTAQPPRNQSRGKVRRSSSERINTSILSEDDRGTFSRDWFRGGAAVVPRWFRGGSAVCE